MDYEKIILQRYKDAELEEANFVEKNLQRKVEADKNNEAFIAPLSHRREVFLFIYYAGHGCEDGKQWFILNEKTPDECFWPAESRIRAIGRLCGLACKLFVVYDCCRIAKEDEYAVVNTAYQKIAKQ